MLFGYLQINIEGLFYEKIYMRVRVRARQVNLLQ
jgi:hypothetical protein